MTIELHINGELRKHWKYPDSFIFGSTLLMRKINTDAAVEKCKSAVEKMTAGKDHTWYVKFESRGKEIETN